MKFEKSKVLRLQCGRKIYSDGLVQWRTYAGVFLGVLGFGPMLCPAQEGRRMRSRTDFQFQALRGAMRRTILRCRQREAGCQLMRGKSEPETCPARQEQLRIGIQKRQASTGQMLIELGLGHEDLSTSQGLVKKVERTTKRGSRGCNPYEAGSLADFHPDAAGRVPGALPESARLCEDMHHQFEPAIL